MLDSINESGAGLDIAGPAGRASAPPIGDAPIASLGGLERCVTATEIEAAATVATGGLEVGNNQIAGLTSVNLQ